MVNAVSIDSGMAAIIIVAIILLLILIYICTGYRSTTRTLSNECPNADSLLVTEFNNYPDEEEQRLVDYDNVALSQSSITTDLRNNIIMITGCNSGIGKETLRVLSKTNATIIMACKDVEKSKKIQKQTVRESNNENIFLFELDLADLTQINRFIQEFKSCYNKLDILILNAGVLPNKPNLTTTDNFELAFGVNCIGNLHLLLSLNPLLSDTAKNNDEYSRVIVVGDYTHKRDLGLFGFKSFEYDINGLDSINNKYFGLDSINNKYFGYTAYRYSKLCFLMCLQHFVNTHSEEETHVLCCCVIPGFGETELYPIKEASINNKDRPFIFNDGCCSRIVRNLFCLDSLTNKVEQLAFTSIYCTLIKAGYLKHGTCYRGKEEINNMDPIISDEKEVAELYHKCIQSIKTKIGQQTYM